MLGEKTMQVQVTGKHIDLGNALREHTADKLEAVIGKYAHRLVESNVIFSKEGHSYRCDGFAHLTTGMVAQATGRSGDIYLALDQAVTHLGKQLRRYKQRLKDHHIHRNQPVNQAIAPYYVLETTDWNTEDEAIELSKDASPPIIAESTTQIPQLTIAEAVVQLEMKDAQFLLFRHDGNKRLNIVYRRTDGNIGWVDPK